MSDIDLLLVAMRKHQATELLLEEGKKPTLVVGGSSVAVSVPEMSDAIIMKILTAVLGEPGVARLEKDRAANFVYSSPAGITVSGVASAQGEGLRVRFRPDGATPPAPSNLDAPAAGVTPPPERMERPAGTEPRLHAFLTLMLSRRASDLHMSSMNRPTLRVDGEMIPLAEFPVLPPIEVEQMLFEVTPAKNRRDFKEREDTDFAYHAEGLGRFRVNLFRDRKGVGGVFRTVPSQVMNASDIGLPEGIVNVITKMHKGLVLVTGPTGSGKSTTLTALIDKMNTERSDHIITIEDPIEFLHENRKCLVNQREIGEHTRSFKDALRAALREDPDIILVGEMRDLETTEMAIETSETGHLVFGTLHTTTAVSTVSRIVDQFPADRQGQIRLMLADSLKVVICQTLLKKQGGGRVAALEILVVNNAIANMIREGKMFQIPSIMQTSRGDGMTLLNDALIELVKKKVVAPVDAYAKAIDKAGLKTLFEKNAITLPK
ncbi:MAG: type IV pilus twitching motility protein PilT [bacterium]